VTRFWIKKRHLKHPLIQALDFINNFRVLKSYVRSSARHGGGRGWRCNATYY